MRNLLKYGRKTAILVLILAIPFSILFGCNRTVGRLARDVREAYENGGDDGIAFSDMKKFSSYAENLAGIAASNGVASDTYQKALKTLRTDADTPFSSSTAAEEVYAEGSLIYNRLLTEKGIAEEQKNSAILYFAEMTSARKRLANNDSYNNAARKYNEVLSSFPASILTFGRKSAVVFG